MFFAEDDAIVYPVGHHVVKYQPEARLQEFLNGSENSGGITAVAVSASKR